MKYSLTLRVPSVEIYINKSHNFLFRSQFPRVSSYADINSMSTGAQIIYIYIRRERERERGLKRDLKKFQVQQQQMQYIF